MFFFENNGKLLEVEDVGERASVAEVLIFDLVTSLLCYCIVFILAIIVLPNYYRVLRDKMIVKSVT